jgi:hypothetical protein
MVDLTDCFLRLAHPKRLDTLKYIGFSAFVGLQRCHGGRPEPLASVLFDLARLRNLCPKHADRERIRTLFDLRDSFSSEDVLLSPIDAATLHEMIQRLPVFEREVVIFRAYSFGACVSKGISKQIFNLF